jgi:hypothetical protein
MMFFSLDLPLCPSALSTSKERGTNRKAAAKQRINKKNLIPNY